MDRNTRSKQKRQDAAALAILVAECARHLVRYDDYEASVDEKWYGNLVLEHNQTHAAKFLFYTERARVHTRDILRFAATLSKKDTHSYSLIRHYALAFMGKTCSLLRTISRYHEYVAKNRAEMYVAIGRRIVVDKAEYEQRSTSLFMLDSEPLTPRVRSPLGVLNVAYDELLNEAIAPLQLRAA